MSENRLRIVGYCRVSTEEQASEGASLSVQGEKIRQYCQLYGLDLVELVTDPGASGKSLDRPGVRRIFELLDSGEVRGMVIAKLDRLSRSISDWQMLIDRYFGSDRYQLFSVSDSIDTRTAGGRLVLNVLMSVAQWEREQIVERVREAMTHKKRRMERAGKIPYGYSLAADGVKLVEVAAELETLDLIHALRASGGSLRTIARTLTARAIPTKTGQSAWSHQSVASVLRRSHPNGRSPAVSHPLDQ